MRPRVCARQPLGASALGPPCGQAPPSDVVAEPCVGAVSGRSAGPAPRPSKPCPPTVAVVRRVGRVAEPCVVTGPAERRENTGRATPRPCFAAVVEARRPVRRGQQCGEPVLAGVAPNTAGWCLKNGRAGRAASHLLELMVAPSPVQAAPKTAVAAPAVRGVVSSA